MSQKLQFLCEVRARIMIELGRKFSGIQYPKVVIHDGDDCLAVLVSRDSVLVADVSLGFQTGSHLHTLLTGRRELDPADYLSVVLWAAGTAGHRAAVQIVTRETVEEFAEELRGPS